MSQSELFAEIKANGSQADVTHAARLLAYGRWMDLAMLAARVRQG